LIDAAKLQQKSLSPIIQNGERLIQNAEKTQNMIILMTLFAKTPISAKFGSKIQQSLEVKKVLISLRSNDYFNKFGVK